MYFRASPIFALALLCGGCTGTFEQPEQPARLQPVNNYYPASDYENDLKSYNDDVLAGTVDSLKKAKLLRDKMATSIAADIDYNYGEYKGKVHVYRAGINTVTDAASLGLTAAVTVVGGSALKSILGAADTALKGTTQSYNNNFYEQKATEILVNSMDAIRTAKETEIIKNLALPVDQYSFGEAKMDLIKLFFLGTREAGLSALEADAGKKSTDATADAAKVAQEKVDQASLFRFTPSDEQTNMASDIRQRINSISAGGDDNLNKGIAILKRAKITPTDASSLTAVVSDLNKLAAQANSDVSKLPAIHSYFYP
jgi:hypothetical protein